MSLWLQVNTSTGDIYANLSTPADASGLPVEPGGSWVQVDPIEFDLARNGERVSWNNAASSPNRVEENPYPRLRFTGGNVTGKAHEFALEVGQASPPQLTIESVDRDGNALNLNATRRIRYYDNGVEKFRDISLASGSLTLDIPVGSARVLRINNQKTVLTPAGAEADGFIAENPLLIVVAAPASDTNI